MNLLSPDFAPILIFFLRILNNAVGTVRVIMMTEDRRIWGFALASFESLLFAYTAGLVITNLENVPNLAAYVLGFAVGGYVGMFIERKFHNLYDTITIICSLEKGHEIAVALREADHGVTEAKGEGAMGEVMTLRIVTHQNDIKEVIGIARDIKPDAFITVEPSIMIRNGWIHAHHKQHER